MKKSKILAVLSTLVITGALMFAGNSLIKADNAKELTIENGVYIGGIDVSGMNTQQATEAVNSYVEGLKTQPVTLIGPKSNMQLTLGQMGLVANTSEAVEEAVGIGKSGNLIDRYKTLKDLEKESHVIDMGLSIDKQATAQSIYANVENMNIKASDNGLKRENGQFVFVPGQAGNEVDIVAAVNALNEYIGTEWETAAVADAEFTLESIVSEPRGTQEELAKVTDLLGSFSTGYSSSGWGRAKNVENGASKINGTLLFPGEELSVYSLVNPFTQANGYELAGSYLNGETVESFGGGICQVSTTLYNAALRAELDITARSNHSMIVTYVDLAADAAIAGTYKDLKFKNNYDYPVYIEGTWAGRRLTFNIYGHETRPANRTVTYVSEKLSENDPPTEYQLSKANKVGYYEVARSKHVGYTAKLWKVIKIDGVETDRIEVNKSSYSASAKKVIIGTGGATEEQLAIIQAALATKDDDHIKAVIKSINDLPEEEEGEGDEEDKDGEDKDDEDKKPSDEDKKPNDEDKKPNDEDKKPSDEDKKPNDEDKKPSEEEEEPDSDEDEEADE